MLKLTHSLIIYLFKKTEKNRIPLEESASLLATVY